MFCCCCCFPLDCFGTDAKGCCSFLSQKVYQIINLISCFFLIIFLIATMSIIQWERFPKINLLLFLIILFAIVACTILGILIICYTQSINPSNETKEKAFLIAKIGFIITIVYLVLTVLEEIFISISFANVSSVYPCNDESVTVSTQVNIGFFFYKLNGTNSDIIQKRTLSSKTYECYSVFLTAVVYGMTYVTLTFIEIISVISICFWSKEKKDNQVNNFNYKYNNNYNNNYIQANNNYNYQQNPNLGMINQNIQPQIVIVNNENAQEQPYSYPQNQNSNYNNENRMYNQNEQNNMKENNIISGNNGTIEYPNKRSVLVYQGNQNNNNIDTPLDSRSKFNNN